MERHREEIGRTVDRRRPRGGINLDLRGREERVRIIVRNVTRALLLATAIIVPAFQCFSKGGGDGGQKKPPREIALGQEDAGLPTPPLYVLPRQGEYSTGTDDDCTNLTVAERRAADCDNPNPGH